MAIRAMVFRSAVAVLFGDGLALSVPGGIEQLEETFFEFEEAFEVHDMVSMWIPLFHLNSPAS